MRILGIVALGATLVILPITGANAGPKRTQAECKQKAFQAGFTGSGGWREGRQKRDFVVACMQGK
jgi:hypothetical protein